MTPEAANWVYDVVLTQAYKRGAGCDDNGAAAVRTCECQWGPCGECGRGRPDRCSHRRGLVKDHTSPETYIVSRGGGALTEVWRAGRPCSWRCAGPDLRAAVQPELFAVGGAR